MWSSIIISAGFSVYASSNAEMHKFFLHVPINLIGCIEVKLIERISRD